MTPTAAAPSAAASGGRGKVEPGEGGGEGGRKGCVLLRGRGEGLNGL